MADFEQLLGPCENKAIEATKAQEVVDWLDQVSSELPDKGTS